MNQLEILRNKDKIIDYVLKDEALVDLLRPKKEEDFIPEDLINDGIYNYYKVPRTQEEAGIYLTVAADIPTRHEPNSLTKNIEYTITVITHDSLMEVKGNRANRNDLIGSRIDFLFNEHEDFGIGKLHLVTSDEGVLDTGQPFRVMKFDVIDFNNNRNPKRKW